VAYPSDNLADVLTTLGTDAGTASSSLGTIGAGTDVLISNFAGLQSLVNDLSNLASVLKNQTFYVPVGGIIPFGGDAASVLPGGWLLCDGSSQLRSAYADLFTVIGTSYGSVDSTHFNLPDLRGRTVIGVGTGSGLSARSLAATVGAESLPAHTHSFSASTAYNAWLPVQTFDNEYNMHGSASGFKAVTGWNEQGNSVSGTSGSTGSGSHGVMQPSLVLSYIIKV